MAGLPYTIEQVLPHARPMILLDEVIDWKPDRLVAAVTIRPTQPFFGSNVMPSHVAIEFMAQSCGAFIGVEALEEGRTPRIGLLLGTRNFNARQQWFHDGERLRVTVEVVFRENEMAIFDCCVANAANDDVLASAKLTVYQPSAGENFEAFNG